MRHVSTTSPLPWPVEIPDEWMAACEGRRNQPPQDAPRVPKALELALIRGLIEERGLPENGPAPRWVSAGRVAAAVTIWAFAAYGLWSLLG